MKRRNILASCLLLGSMIVGCSCNKDSVDTHANVSYEKEPIVSNKNNKFTVGDVYDYMFENQKDTIVKNILSQAMEKKIDLKNPEMLSLYKKYLNEYFEKTFVDNSSYMFNGDFDERLVVEYLNSESYAIKCGNGVSSGLLDNSNFSCDYSDYIKKEVNYDIYVKMLKIRYIIEEKANLIDKNLARRITYYTIAKGSEDNVVREQLEEYVASIEENYNSNDTTLIRNISDIAEAKRKKDLEKIAEEYAYLSTSQDSSSGYTYLNKFTKCGDKRCSIEAGKEYQDNLIMEKDYYTTEIVTKQNESVLYEAARELLYSDNVEDYFYKIGDTNYLMSPAYGDKEDKRVKDIIMFDSANSNYYLVAVDIIDSESAFEDKVLVAELLLDKISDSTIIDYCLEDSDIEIHDKAIKEYFESKYGKLKSE
jgi:hypothetical protein